MYVCIGIVLGSVPLGTQEALTSHFRKTTSFDFRSRRSDGLALTKHERARLDSGKHSTGENRRKENEVVTQTFASRCNKAFSILSGKLDRDFCVNVMKICCYPSLRACPPARRPSSPSSVTCSSSRDGSAIWADPPQRSAW